MITRAEAAGDLGRLREEIDRLAREERAFNREGTGLKYPTAERQALAQQRESVTRALRDAEGYYRGGKDFDAVRAIRKREIPDVVPVAKFPDGVSPCREVLECVVSALVSASPVAGDGGAAIIDHVRATLAAKGWGSLVPTKAVQP